jgi:ribosomal protein S18 acetylase RimI-like enzyme
LQLGISDYFNVTAFNKHDEVIGRLNCIQNKENHKRWYYGDLAVKSTYRRIKIATRLVEAAVQRIADLGGEILCCYVEPDNKASICLQNSLGFIEKPTIPFDLLTVVGQIMFEYNIEHQYNVIPATAEEARFVMMFYNQNKDTLHSKHVSLTEWQKILSTNDPDEENFLICKGAMPIAWMRLNGLDGKDIAWISMLAVCDKSHRKGIGTYAVNYAESYVKSRGFSKLGIQTTEDNISAIALFQKCGYIITVHKDGMYPDGTTGKSFVFEKELS